MRIDHNPDAYELIVDAGVAQRCLDCNGSGTTYGAKCETCGQRRQDEETCPRCNGSGEDPESSVGYSLRRKR